VLPERYALHDEGYERVIMVLVKRWVRFPVGRPGKEILGGVSTHQLHGPRALSEGMAYAVHCTGFHYAVGKCSLLPFSGLGSLSK
jgi:hypothetical protein